MAAQDAQNMGFDKFKESFENLLPDDEYVVVDKSEEDEQTHLLIGDVKKYLSLDLNSDEKSYPIGIYNLDGIYCFRVQVVFFGRPKLIDEYLITVTKDGIPIDKIRSGGYSADVEATYTDSSQISDTLIKVANYRYMHLNIGESISGENKLQSEEKTYRLCKDGKFSLLTKKVQARKTL